MSVTDILYIAVSVAHITLLNLGVELINLCEFKMIQSHDFPTLRSVDSTAVSVSHYTMI